MKFTEDDFKRVSENMSRDRGTDRILISSSEWREFKAACERVGADPSSADYFAWRMKQPPFDFQD